jgi:hypothetical protein
MLENRENSTNTNNVGSYSIKTESFDVNQKIETEIIKSDSYLRNCEKNFTNNNVEIIYEDDADDFLSQLIKIEQTSNNDNYFLNNNNQVNNINNNNMNE